MPSNPNGVWNMGFEHKMAPVVLAFRDAEKGLQGYKPAFKRIAVELSARIRKNVRAGQAPDGTKWKPLSKRYGRRKGGRAAGVASGKLIQTLGNPSQATIRLTKTKLRFGVRDLPYARTFQFGRKPGRTVGSTSGKPDKRTPIPPRPLLWNNDVERDDDPYFLLIQEMLADYQDEIIDKVYRKMSGLARGG